MCKGYIACTVSVAYSQQNRDLVPSSRLQLVELGSPPNMWGSSSNRGLHGLYFDARMLVNKEAVAPV